ncbi:MAG TPA: hypothetical protein VNW52_13305 [Burkholderiaceae bacterium]|jgi:hypothetical protein|nr:hypothetical protein [Burkholderiaceae bacterium]
MRKIIGATVAMLFAVTANAVGVGDMFGAFAGRFDTYGAGPDGQAKQLDDVLLKMSEYMNKRMPEAIDDQTRLDRVSAEPGAHFSYHYTLLASRSNEIDKVGFATTIRQQLKSKLCDSAQIRSFFNHGVTVGYLYQGNDGLPIAGTDFLPNSCDDATSAPSKP